MMYHILSFLGAAMFGAGLMLFIAAYCVYKFLQDNT